jgi:hypothetical protein
VRSAVTIAIVVSLAVNGCDTRRPPPEPWEQPADPWLAPAPAGAAHNWLDRDRFAPVTEPLRAEAVAALAATSVLRLTAAEAARFAGRELPADGEFFLLRGAAMGETHGSYSVSTFGDSVNVMHMCLGRPSGPVTHGAVVAAFPTTPKAVYVNYGWYK